VLKYQENILLSRCEPAVNMLTSSLQTFPYFSFYLQVNENS